MHWVFASWTEVWQASAKMAVLFLMAVLALRLTERRTVARFSAFDFVASVAVGAIIGRTATSATTPLADGAAALLALMLLHSVVSRLRYSVTLRHLVDHSPRLLVVDGEVRTRELVRVGLTDSDLQSSLREKGLTSVHEARYVIFESRGTLSVVRRDAAGEDLLAAGLRAAGEQPLAAGAVSRPAPGPRR